MRLIINQYMLDQEMERKLLAEMPRAEKRWYRQCKQARKRAGLRAIQEQYRKLVEENRRESRESREGREGGRVKNGETN